MESIVAVEPFAFCIPRPGFPSAVTEPCGSVPVAFPVYFPSLPSGRICWLRRVKLISSYLRSSECLPAVALIPDLFLPASKFLSGAMSDALDVEIRRLALLLPLAFVDAEFSFDMFSCRCASRLTFRSMLSEEFWLARSSSIIRRMLGIRVFVRLSSLIRSLSSTPAPSSTSTFFWYSSLFRANRGSEGLAPFPRSSSRYALFRWMLPLLLWRDELSFRSMGRSPDVSDSSSMLMSRCLCGGFAGLCSELPFFAASSGGYPATSLRGGAGTLAWKSMRSGTTREFLFVRAWFDPGTPRLSLLMCLEDWSTGACGTN